MQQTVSSSPAQYIPPTVCRALSQDTAGGITGGEDHNHDNEEGHNLNQTKGDDAGHDDDDHNDGDDGADQEASTQFEWAVLLQHQIHGPVEDSSRAPPRRDQKIALPTKAS
jgi:hypothetical protein